MKLPKIPSGWLWKTVDELGTSGRPAVKAGPFGSSLKKEFYVESGFRIYGQEQVIAGDLSIGDYYISRERFEALKSCEIKAGDILISLVGTFGKVLVVPSLFEPGIINPRLVRLCLDPKLIDPHFFSRFFRSPLARLQMDLHSHGGTMDILNAKNISGLFIPIPPIAQQRRIAEILDRADAIRRKRQEAIRLTEELLRSAFLEMFGDPVTNSKGWETRYFGDVGTLDRGRSRHRPRNDPSLLGGSYPLIQTGDVANSNGVIRNYTQTYSEKGLAQSKMWSAGTLCITIAANIAQTGILAFDACFPDSVVGFHPGLDVSIQYVQGWLGFLQPNLEERAPQSAQKNINLQILRELELPVPPIAIQQQYADFVIRFRQYVARTEVFHQNLDKLFNSLLQRAFRGEL